MKKDVVKQIKKKEKKMQLNVDTILAFLPQDTYKCGDPSFKERYPLQIYWA